MTLFRGGRNYWDVASNGDLKSLRQHVRKRVTRKMQKCAGIDEQCPFSGLTALHFACANGHLACVKLLLEYGANSNFQARTMSGKTPLHLACENGQFKVVRLLIECNESLEDLVNDFEGNSVLHFACKSNSLRVVKLFFEKFGAKALTEFVEPGEYTEKIDDFLYSQFQDAPIERFEI